VAVASSVWSTAAMNIGRKTAANRLRNSARETVAPGLRLSSWVYDSGMADQWKFNGVRVVRSNELDINTGADARA
jgi:hypothetical protein